jgi:hypothetical protein
MASFESQRSTKTLVILTRPEEWSLWLFQHKDKAVSHGVWEYCDLSVPSPPALYPQPERPMCRMWEYSRREEEGSLFYEVYKQAYIHERQEYTRKCMTSKE